MVTLSVAIPTFNGADTISETVRSLDQDGVNEIIISDNCSTDATETVIKNLHNNKIRYYRNIQNLGFDKNCDLAVKRATGEYVWLFSDDDIMQPGAAKKVCNLLSCYSTLSIVSVNHSIRDYTLKKKMVERFNPDLNDCLTHGLDEFLSVVWKHHSLISTNVVRQENWVGIGYTWFIGSGFLHVGKIYEMVDMAYYIAEPLVINRSGNGRGLCMPDKIVNIELNRIKLLIDSSAKRQTVKKCIAEYIRTIPNRIIWSKRINRSFTVFPSLLKYFWTSPYFLIVCVPLMVLPCEVYHIGAGIKKLLKLG